MAKPKNKNKKGPANIDLNEKGTTRIYWIISALLLVFSAHFISLFNGFTNWDDPSYVTRNEFIKAFSSDNLRIIFGEFHNGHYHPVTWLSLALDYSFFELKPFGYHLFNLIFHLINVFFVYVFIKNLTLNWKLGVFTALLFGISPLTVESVSWITERKNLLYTLFYLSSLIVYLRFLNKRKTSLFLYSMLLFLLSVLSKSMAITLPIVLLLIDYYKGRKIISKNTLLEKTPFLLISFLFGIAAIIAQSKVGYEATEHISINSKIMYGSWGFMNYFIKVLFPFNLSAFYPYLPNNYPTYYLAGVIFTLIFIWFVIRSWKKNNRTLVFGFLFFVINLVLLLKFFDTIANSVYMADRYTYLSSVGLFFILGTILVNLKKENGIILILVFTAYYGIYTVSQTKVWKDSLSLWNNVIIQYPGAHVPLLNRGNALRDDKQYNKALADYNLILNTNPTFFEALVNRGYVFDMLGNYDLALKDYELALTLRPDDKNTIYNRSLCLQRSGQSDLAINEVKKQIDSGNVNASSYNILGNASFDKKELLDAVTYYTKAIELDPGTAQYWYNRANSYAMQKQHNEALSDYNKAIELEKTNADYFFNRGTTRFFLKDYTGANADMQEAIKINPKNPTYYLNKSNVELALGNNNNAINDLTSAINLDVNNAQNYARRAVIYFQMNKTAEGCKDANTSVRLGFTQANELLQKYCK